MACSHGVRARGISVVERHREYAYGIVVLRESSWTGMSETCSREIRWSRCQQNCSYGVIFRICTGISGDEWNEREWWTNRTQGQMNEIVRKTRNKYCRIWRREIERSMAELNVHALRLFWVVHDRPQPPSFGALLKTVVSAEQMGVTDLLRWRCSSSKLDISFLLPTLTCWHRCKSTLDYPRHTSCSCRSYLWSLVLTLNAWSKAAYASR